MMMDVISFIVSFFCNVFRAVLAYLAYKKKEPPLVSKLRRLF